MDNMLLSKKARLDQAPYLENLGLEYEKLYDWLEDRREQKYSITDSKFRLLRKDESKILSPGFSNKDYNPSAITFEEPMSKAVYPVVDVPYSYGISWE